jgi:hypothetical protein
MAERHHLDSALRAPFDAIESIVERYLAHDRARRSSR